MKAAEIASDLVLDTTVFEEFASLPDDAIFEMANLYPDDTGIEGVIFISTAMASHGPRIKYFVKAGKSQPSFSMSISATPEIKANSLPAKVRDRMEPIVSRWVALNHVSLLHFWNEGDSWSIRQVAEFAARLQRV